MTNLKSNIEEIKLYMKEVMNIEHYVARLQGKEEKWVEKWSTFREEWHVEGRPPKNTTRTR